MVIVDTNVWSLALRRSKSIPNQTTDQLKKLIEANAVVMFGAIRQELLTGLRNKDQFEKLKSQLRNFPDLPITTVDYESAAELHTICIQNGIQCSPTDILICAASINNNLEIFTLDKNFEHYQRVLPIKLLS